MKQRSTTQRVIGMIIGLFTGLLAFVFVNEILYPPQSSQQLPVSPQQPAMAHDTIPETDTIHVTR